MQLRHAHCLQGLRCSRLLMQSCLRPRLNQSRGACYRTIASGMTARSDDTPRPTTRPTSAILPSAPSASATLRCEADATGKRKRRRRDRPSATRCNGETPPPGGYAPKSDAPLHRTWAIFRWEPTHGWKRDVIAILRFPGIDLTKIQKR